jgi:hypothetical protein
MKKMLFLLLFINASVVLKAQKSWNWTTSATVGFADNVFDLSSYRNLYDFQKGAPTFTFSVGYLYKPFAKKTKKKKESEHWIISNMRQTNLQASVGARKLSYTGFTHRSSDLQSPEKYAYNIREKINSYYATLNAEINIPVGQYFALSAAYERQILATASRNTDEYYLSETKGKNYSIPNIRKDNFTDSLRTNDAFFRIGLVINTSKHTKIFYQHGFDLGLNLVNRYHRYFYEVNEIGFRYIF